MLAIPWVFRETLGVTPHTSWELDQILLLDPVVEAVVDTPETGADIPDFRQYS